MKTTGKLICGLGGIAAVAIGIYKVVVDKEPPKHSYEWIKNLTDKEWETEREIIRQKFCNPKYDDKTRIGFQNLLRLFDKVKSEGREEDFEN